MISKDQHENIICTFDNARVDLLGPLHVLSKLNYNFPNDAINLSRSSGALIRSDKYILRIPLSTSATEASSVTREIWQHGAKVNYWDYPNFNRIVDTKTNFIQISQICKPSTFQTNVLIHPEG